MPNAYHDIAFTDAVKSEQTARGSRASYARFEAGKLRNDKIGPAEQAFLADMRSFYMASVNADGWPYIQHRGGPRGFIRVLDEGRIGFADFSGNKQYVSLGNLKGDDRVALFFMDYANKRRLKAFGHATFVEGDAAQELAVPGYKAEVERGVILTLDGVEWNCPQHIPERYDVEDVQAATTRLGVRIAELEAQVKALGGTV